MTRTLGAMQSSDKSSSGFFIQPQIVLSIITLSLHLKVDNLSFWSCKTWACAQRDDVTDPSHFRGRLRES